MRRNKVQAALVACIAATGGLVTAASLVLSAPASGQLTGDNCTGDARHQVCTEPAPVVDTVPVETTPTTEVGCEDFVQGACADHNSVVSGNGTAVNGSVASGCSMAVNKSTASGGNCAPAKKASPAPAPARAVSRAPSFAG